MAKMIQLTISCQNRPGALAEIAGILGKANVNILAFNVGSAGTCLLYTSSESPRTRP